jgi:DNA-binding response OmpR family regulator
VLLIRNGEGMCDYSTLNLQKKVEFIQVETIDEGLVELKDKTKKISTIVLDSDLEDQIIIEFLSKLQRNLEWNYIPTLVTTEENQDRRLVERVEAGAFYYLNKTSESDLLVAVLNKALKDYTTYTFYLQKAVNLHISNLITQGSFKLRTFKEAHEVSDWLASLCTGRARDDVVVGFNELLLNAIEHGNLGVSYDEKTELMKEGDYMEKLVSRLAQPEHQNKYVHVEFTKSKNELHVLIIDMGEGFDFEKYLVLDKERMFHSHGKGIMMAKNLYFDELLYETPGNRVRITIKLS